MGKICCFFFAIMLGVLEGLDPGLSENKGDSVKIFLELPLNANVATWHDFFSRNQ